ncbi:MULTISPECIES: potassium channel family protein [Alteromonas]|uniref:Potassium channel family protein n=1 Tax=Alteromonas stellipolaris TaxID=233316 RepID=A0AAW7Z371_9ALTE|nr:MULTISPECIES: potassium channel family protein [Alteromonas]AMJ85184.1 hypothetical protein AV939_00440 [Alteromonas sp. Mac1]AMJ89070.1 hypothetical protein AV940_00440 [Alteromonas sp. Mac2]MDO6577618.1 potassium channel family protein [Alteromonas stellipolaris]
MSSFNYINFIDYLKTQLDETNNAEINGFEVLFDYLKDYPPEYLEDDDSDFFREEIDRLAQDQIDELVYTLKDSENDWLEIKGEKWRIKDNESNQGETKTKLYSKLTAKEAALLDKKSGDVDSEERTALVNLYNNKVNSLGSVEEKYHVAKLIVDKFIYTEDGKKEYHQFLITAGETGSEKKDKDSYKYYEHLAKFYRQKYEHELSAQWYKDAANTANICNEKEETILKLTRNERLQFEQAGREEEAAEAYIRENDLIAKVDGRRRTRFIYSSLKHVSDYFQNPKKVACVAILFILVSSFIFSISGITPSGGTVQSWRAGKFFSVETITEFGDALYFSVVTFTTLGYGDYTPSNIISRIVTIFLSIGGLLLASLFLVTLVKRYGR